MLHAHSPHPSEARSSPHPWRGDAVRQIHSPNAVESAVLQVPAGTCSLPIILEIGPNSWDPSTRATTETAYTARIYCFLELRSTCQRVPRGHAYHIARSIGTNPAWMSRIGSWVSIIIPAACLYDASLVLEPTKSKPGLRFRV
jgi:hypothetical protein